MRSVHHAAWMADNQARFLLHLLQAKLYQMSSNLLSMLRPCFQRKRRASSLCFNSSWLAFFKKLLSDWSPFETHRKIPPAEYCVKEYRVSPSWSAVFECRTRAEGISMVEPGGNRMTRPNSHRTRCPPRSGLNLPRAVIAHQPHARFPESMWGSVTVHGPKLNVHAAKTPRAKLRWSVLSDLHRMDSVSS